MLARAPSEREQIAEEIAERLDRPLSVAGVIFALVVLADSTIEMQGGLRTAFDVAGWVLWGLFVVEFTARLVVAPSTAAFLRKNWWQVLFLAVPFLRFLRPLARLRVPRLGRILSSAVRTSRSAGRRLSGRVAWLAALTVIVILAASQLIYEFGDYEQYLPALHDAALAAVTGEPIGQDSAVVQVLEVVLAIFSVVVFAALAGALGAFFLERRDDGEDPSSGQA